MRGLDWTSLLLLVAPLLGHGVTPNDGDTEDWLLVFDERYKAKIHESVCWSDRLCGVEITNGLISRRLALEPAFGTVDYLVKEKGSSWQSMFRAVAPEAEVVLDIANISRSRDSVGGLIQNVKGSTTSYCNRTELADSLSVDPRPHFAYKTHRITTPIPPFPWSTGVRHSMELPWPPQGVTLEVDFVRRPHHDMIVTIHYEMYDCIPVMAKWLSMRSNIGVKILNVSVEMLESLPPFGSYSTNGARPPYAATGGAPEQYAPPPLLHALTDQAHGTECSWIDKSSDFGASEPKLVCNYTIGPGIQVNKHKSFDSFKVFELSMPESSYGDLTRHTLARHRMTQVLIPYTTENPTFFHVMNDVDNFTSFRRAVDQAALVGFEMIVYSFSSGFDLEAASTNATQLELIRQEVNYAHSKGLEVGGYDLICLARGKYGYGGSVGDEWTALDARGNFTNNACFATGWYDMIQAMFDAFLNATAISMVILDGPYGGESCSASNHSHHEGLEDSIYQQTQLQNKFLYKLRQRGVYVHQPDNYFFQGGHRAAMGYSEMQFTLSRWQDITISRMGLYDDLYSYLPTQGWMFAPLDHGYHEGDTNSTFANHALALNWLFGQYLGGGTCAVFRGTRVFDETTAVGRETKQIVMKWLGFFQQYRSILIQPIVHLRRPTMQGWDGWLHVHPWDSRKKNAVVGLAMIFNPTSCTLKDQRIVLPLYYTGLTEIALIQELDGRDMLLEQPDVVQLERDYSVTIVTDLEPRTIRTFLVRNAETFARKDRTPSFSTSN